MDFDCLDKTRNFGSSRFPYSRPPLCACPGSRELICLFLSGEQAQAPPRPLLSVGRDVVLLMLPESLGTASGTSPPWSQDLGCSHQPFGPRGSFPASCLVTSASNKGWIQSPKQGLKESVSQQLLAPFSFTRVSMSTCDSRLSSLKKYPRRGASRDGRSSASGATVLCM